jgi:hypothetical protein
LEDSLQRHTLIARFLQQHCPPQLDLGGKIACEIGASDCLAGASFFAAKGARHVNIVQVEAPVVQRHHLEILRRLQKDGLPVDLTIIEPDPEPRLNPKRVTHHPVFMEDFKSEKVHELIFSFSVMEHVEDLKGFYASCWNALQSGGWMLHLVDLSGHGELEDPVPPLDFQTYPDWLYNLMFPRYQRATRRFFNEHVSAVSDAGFIIHEATPTRRADAAYIDGLWRKLRPAAKSHPREDLQVLEFLLVARKR